MIIHIFEDTPHHYLNMRKFFLEYCSYKGLEQCFWAKSPSKGIPLDGFSYYKNTQELKRKLYKKNNDASVLIHGSFEVRTWLMLLLHRNTSQMSYVFWGAELYRYQMENITVKQKLIQLMHRALCKRINKVICLNSGDAVLVDKYLKRNDAIVLPYPIQGIDLDKLSCMPDKPINTGTLRLLVGNSASPSNNHISVLKQLEKYAGEDIRVICTLNYAGPQDYIDDVIAHGRKSFGEKFEAITEMLTKQQHNQLIESVDACIFSHDRQQGLFVVYAMFAYGKAVFMKRKITSFSFLTELGFSLNETDNIDGLNWQDFLLLISLKTNNLALLKNTLSEEALAPQWIKLMKNL
jgi:dTDP-N-acetylfucosamine:lipid II N-acetylfucosaminyltransferase